MKSQDMQVILDNQIWLGNTKAHKDLSLLQSFNITSVVNLGICCGNPERYHPEHIINVLPIYVEDSIHSKIMEYAETAAKFIDNNLEANRRILVHCCQGVSRSTTVLLYYLLTRKKMTLAKAFKIVKDRRSVISPNIGFWKQLIDLESKLFDIDSPTLSLELYRRISIQERFPNLEEKIIYDALEKAIKKKNKDNLDNKHDFIGWYAMDILREEYPKHYLLPTDNRRPNHPFY